MSSSSISRHVSRLVTKLRLLSSATPYVSDSPMHEPVDHVTGIEKRELLAYIAGECDPWHIMPIKRGPGTRSCPNLIPSAFLWRHVGCICDKDVFAPKWMVLHMCEPRRCNCGYWFELCPVAPL